MNDIFISHAHEPTDREFAASLRQLLMSTGYDVSRDYPKDTVHPRDYWESQIRAAIEDCSVVIVLLSKEYLTSEYCLREMRHAISTQRFLPIALPNFEWAAWAEPIWLECNAVVSADLGSDNFSWWLSDELRDTYGLSSRKGDQYDEKRRPESGRFRDARVHWVSKSPLQLMKTARHHPELNPGTHDIIKHILFPAQTGQELERPGERSDAGNVQDLGAACVMTDKALNDDLRLWRPTRHYGRLLTEGRNRPAPSIGSPTLFWHLAIWRKRIEGDGGYREALTKKNVQKYVDHNRNFFHEISHFLRHLQDRGLVSSSTPRDITLDEIPISASRNDDADPFERFEAFLPQGMNFELWWLDGANRDNPNRRLDASKSTKEEIDGATRVLVQFQSFQDHVTCTFYMDIAQQFDGHQILDADELSTCGARKRKIGEILHSIRKASLGHVKSGAIDAPERISSDDPAIPSALRLGSDELQTAVKYLYEEIWEEFQGAFSFELPNFGSEGLKFGVVFVNHRGLLLSHRGLYTPADEARRSQIARLRELNSIAPWGDESSGFQKRPWKPSERAAGDTLGPVDLFDEESSEAEVVLRSLGPFLEEMSPGVLDRDWVGCAILNSRAIFVSPLATRADVSVNAMRQPLSKPTTRHWPERLLVLSKGEPNKQQIGRFIERINSLETIRIFALINLGIIQNCYHYLGVLTSELDNILKFWNDRREFLKHKFNVKLDVRPSRYALERSLDELEQYVNDQILAIARDPAKFDGPLDISADQKERLYYELLSLLNESIEKKLIEITADMEGMGPRGSAHVLQDIQHATYLVDDFNRMVETLEIGNLHGWIDYKQFADREMRPTFGMIQKAGDRLRGAQERIKALTDVIQVTGLIVQSDATRRNTAVLRSMASDFRDWNNWRFTKSGLVYGLFVAGAIFLWRFLG